MLLALRCVGRYAVGIHRRISAVVTFSVPRFSLFFNIFRFGNTNAFRVLFPPVYHWRWSTATKLSRALEESNKSRGGFRDRKIWKENTAWLIKLYRTLVTVFIQSCVFLLIKWDTWYIYTYISLDLMGSQRVPISISGGEENFFQIRPLSSQLTDHSRLNCCDLWSKQHHH